MMPKLIFWAGGLLICVFIGNFIPRTIIKIIRKDTPPAPLTLPLGWLEILSYAISWIIGYPIFIAIWLGVKTANRWQAQQTDSIKINSFLIGNLLSIFIGVYLGAMFKNYLVDLGLIGALKYFLPGLN